MNWVSNPVVSEQVVILDTGRMRRGREDCRVWDAFFHQAESIERWQQGPATVKKPDYKQRKENSPWPIAGFSS